jgi:hypothetical protein
MTNDDVGRMFSFFICTRIPSALSLCRCFFATILVIVLQASAYFNVAPQLTFDVASQTAATLAVAVAVLDFA